MPLGVYKNQRMWNHGGVMENGKYTLAKSENNLDWTILRVITGRDKKWLYRLYDPKLPTALWLKPEAAGASVSAQDKKKRSTGRLSWSDRNHYI